MNRTVGLATLVTGIFFILSGLLYITGTDAAGWAVICSLNAALFLDSGLLLAVVGILLMQDVRVAPPGSLMVRRGRKVE